MMPRLAVPVLLLCAAAAAAPPVKSPPAAKSERARVTATARRGLDFLRKKQEQDGSWQHYPGITAVCLLACARHGLTEKDPAVARASAYLVSQARPNGAIYTDAMGPAQALPNYNTALSLAALHAVGSPRHREVIRRAQEFLARSQYDEEEGFTRQQSQYGGIGYGSKEDNPDLSNLQNALEALRDSGYPRNSAVFEKALLFLQRCQNRRPSNDQAWSGDDGGFVYAASGESKADANTRKPHSSYGSMTYAGLKSYLYCSVSRDDPRVRSAWSWLRANYDVEQNPRMGVDGLYYYYHTMSKTLSLWGDRTVVDAAGKKRAWGPDVAGALLRRQRADGSWANTNARWWEDRPELATGYALITLANCLTAL